MERTTMTQMRARPRHWFSWGFDLYLGGEFLVRLDMSWLRERGRFTYEGREYRLSREGLWSGDFLLTADEQVLARATKGSAWLRRFVVRTGQRELLLIARASRPGRLFFRLRQSRQQHRRQNSDDRDDD